MAVGGEVVLDFSKITFADVLTKLFRIFASPSANINVLWAIIPAYANWVFREILFEKQSSLANVFMNGFTCIWSGVTWIKYLAENTEFLKIFFNSSLAIFLVIFGVILMIISLLKQEVLFILGNPRITSPLIICFTPVIYGLIIFDALFIVGTVLFLVIGNLIIISIPNLKGKD